MTDLDKLIEAVEAGNLFRPTWATSFDAVGYEVSGKARDAYNGSLDAAKALHEALLPGCDYSIDREVGRHSVYIWRDTNMTAEGESFVSDARSWLIAILKAYRAQVGEKNSRTAFGSEEG